MRREGMGHGRHAPPSRRRHRARSHSPTKPQKRPAVVVSSEAYCERPDLIPMAITALRPLGSHEDTPPSPGRS